MRWCDESLNRDFRFACHGWPLFIHPRAAEPYTVLTQVGEGAAEAVELPDDEHVARPERAHATVESRSVVYAGREVLVDVDGVDARSAAGPATGSRLPSSRGRSRSACIVNGRLGHIGTHTALAGCSTSRHWRRSVTTRTCARSTVSSLRRESRGRSRWSPSCASSSCWPTHCSNRTAAGFPNGPGGTARRSSLDDRCLRGGPGVRDDHALTLDEVEKYLMTGSF